MDNSIQEAISEIEYEISVARERIELLNSFETLSIEGLSETDYHKLCETDLRITDLLGKALLVPMPFLIYKERDPNNFIYYTDDNLEIQIPSSNSKCVKIIVDDYYKNENATKIDFDIKYSFCKINCDKEIDRLYQYLNSSSIGIKSQIAYPDLFKPFAFIKYIFNINKCNKTIKKRLIELWKKRADMSAEKDDKIKQLLNKRDKQQILLLKYAEQFLNWTDNVFVYERGWSMARAHYSKSQTGEIVNKED